MSEKNKVKLIPVVQELKSILEAKAMSPETATSFVKHITSRQLRRWLDGESVPSDIFKNEIQKAINRLKKLK